MRSSLRLGRVFGVELRLDSSWFIIFVLITWSLASHYFPMAHPGWAQGMYWAMGLATALLFFASIVAHELAHSLVSERTGTPVRDITLFIFGGAAQLDQEPRRARDEFLMALAGPATSLAVAGGFGALWLLSRGASDPIHALAGWLAQINAILALFNLLPGFPLDGGRVFRAIVWGLTGNLRRATRLASALGQLVAFGFIFWGIAQVFTGNWTDGLWIAFIGWFLYGAAKSSVQQQALRDLLAGHVAREIMMVDCPQAPRRLTLDVFAEQIGAPSGRRCFPVVENGQIVGLLTLHRLTGVPRDRWATTRVEDAMIPRAELKTVKPDDELMTVFDRMGSEDVNQFPVVEDGHFLGIVAWNNLLRFLRIRADGGST